MSMGAQINSPTASELQSKWGEKALSSGFVLLPSILLKKQHTLGVDASELTVLAHLCMSWWQPGMWPHPNSDTLAKRMGVSRRSVQRYLDGLERKKLVRRFRSFNDRGDVEVTRYDLSGLVEKVKEMV
jgi:DNA-binding MarR family transcriptional regulator